MRAVLYTQDLEPITVLELKQFAVDQLIERGRVRLQLMKKLSLLEFARELSMDVTRTEIRYVEIWGEMFARRGRKHLMLFTSDDEMALLLSPAFLPGQHSRVQERERAAFAKGFMDALNRVMPP